MTATWFDGHMIAALFLCPIAATWFVGMVNNRLAAKARKRAAIDWDLL